MDLKNWDRRSAYFAIKFAREYSKIAPRSKKHLADIVLYVDNALSKKGIIKSKEDIQNFLLNPSMPSSNDSPRSTSSDMKGKLNCNRTEKTPPKHGNPSSKKFESDTESVEGEVFQKECNEAIKEMVPGGKSDTKISLSQQQKQSENQAGVIAVPDGNKKNNDTASNSKTSKIEIQTTSIEENKIAKMNNTPGTISSKICRQDDKVLKSKQLPDAQPPVKRLRSRATDEGGACPQGDSVAESNCNEIGEKALQTSTLETNIEMVVGEITKKKCEELAKKEIPVEKTNKDTIIATPKKQKKSENEVNVSKIPERNKRSTRSSISSDSSKTNTGTLNIENDKIGANNDVSKTDSPKTYKQDGKSLKLKQTHDTQPQGDGVDESNSSNNGEKKLQTTTLKTNTKNEDGEVTNEKKCEEPAQGDIPVEKTDTETIIATPKKQKKSEKEVDVSKISEKNKRNAGSASNSDSSKTNTGMLNVENKKTSANNDVPKTDTSKTNKKEGKILKLKQAHASQPAIKRQRSCTTDVACPQGITKKAISSKSDGKDESNCNFTENLHLHTLESNTENLDKEVTENKSDETTKDIPYEKLDTDTMIVTPKKLKMSENEICMSKATDANKKNNRTGPSSDSFKIDITTLNNENTKTGASNDVCKTDSPKTCKQNDKSLKFKQALDTQPAIKRRRTCATDVACPQGDVVDESNNSNIGGKTLQTTALKTNTENIDGKVNENKCEETAEKEIPVEKTTDTIIATQKKQKKSENEVNVSKLPERNKRNTRSSISSDSSKTNTGIPIVENDKINANSGVSKTDSPKTYKQDGKSLKLKQTHDAQPQGDVVDESNNSNIGEKMLQTTALKKNTGNIYGKLTENKCEETAEEEIPVEKSADTIIATQKKQKKSENEVNVSKIPERNKRNTRSSISSDSSETNTGIPIVENDKINANSGVSKTDSPKTYKQDGKSLKLKQTHDAQPQGVCVDEFNSSNFGENILQTITLKTNTENVVGEVTDENKYKETVKEEIPVEESDMDITVATLKKQKKTEKEIGMSKIPEKNKRNTRSASSSDGSKTGTGIQNVENNKTGANNEVPKIGSSNIYKRDRKSLKLKQTHDAQPAVKRQKSCGTDVACLQGNSSIAKDTVLEKEVLIGPDIRTESAKVTQTNFDKSVPLKKDLSDEFNEIKIDKTSKRPKKSDRSKRTTRPRSASNSQNTAICDDKICENLNNESITNESLKNNSSQILVHADVHMSMEIKATEKPSSPPFDSSYSDVETRKTENIDNESVTDSSKNHTHCDEQKPLQTRAASRYSTLPSEDVAVNSSSTKTEHIENETDNKLMETVSSKVHNQLIIQKPMQTRAAKKTPTAPSENIISSAETIKLDNFVNEGNDESVDSSKSSTQSEVQKAMQIRAASQPSAQSSGVSSGDSAQVDSVIEATIQSISVPEISKIKPEQVKQELKIEVKQECDISKKMPKIPSGPTRKNYLRERRKKYQQKKRRELKLKELEENPFPHFFKPGKRDVHQNLHAQRPLCEPFHAAAVLWQQRPTCHVFLRPRYPQTVFSERPRHHTSWPQRPVNRHYNAPIPPRPYWQRLHTASPQHQNLIYLKPIRGIVTKAEHTEEVPATPETCPDSCSKEEPAQAITAEETGECKEDPSTAEPVTQISTDYYASEKVEGISDMKDVESLHLPFKKIKLPLTTPQAPPLCSCEDVLPILGADTSKDTEDEPDPSPNVPAVQDAEVSDDVCSLTQNQSSLSPSMTEGTETATVSETNTIPCTQGWNGFCNLSPPLSPSMVYPDTPRSSKQTSEPSPAGDNNNIHMNVVLMNKITEQVCERVADQVTRQVCERVADQVTRRVEEKLLQRFEDLRKQELKNIEERISSIILETLKSNAKNSQ